MGLVLLAMLLAGAVPASGVAGTVDLHDFWETYPIAGPAATKYAHYLTVYHRHLQHLRGRDDIAMLEIGVGQGGSLQMWRRYLGPGAQLFAVDVDPRCVAMGQLANATVFVADQSDPEALRRVRREIEARVPSGRLDVLLDDGGHTMTQQLTTLRELFDLVRVDGGLYAVEDLHTAFWEEYEGGDTTSRSNFLGELKHMIDELHGFHFRPRNPTSFTRTVFALHVYDSMVFVERGRHSEPRHICKGDRQALDRHFPPVEPATADTLPAPALSLNETLVELAELPPRPLHRPRVPCAFFGNVSLPTLQRATGKRHLVIFPVQMAAVRSLEDAQLELATTFQLMCEVDGLALWTADHARNKDDGPVACGARFVDYVFEQLATECGSQDDT